MARKTQKETPSKDIAKKVDEKNRKHKASIPPASTEIANLELQKTAIVICDFLEQKKALNVLLFDLHQSNPYFHYFLIASANSTPHLDALLNDLQKNFSKELGHTMSSKLNSDSQSGWVILDMIDIVIHLFLEEQRHFYNLERLWGDAKVIYPKC